MTINGRGLVPAGHPLQVSASPSLASIRELVHHADLVLAFGTELGRTDYNMFDRAPFSVSSPLIRADIDPVQIARNQPSDIALVGDSTQLTYAGNLYLPIAHAAGWFNSACGFGEIKSSMINRDVTPIGVDLHTPDFVSLAKAYGLATAAPTSLEELRATLLRAVAAGKPMLIEMQEADFLGDHT